MIYYAVIDTNVLVSALLSSHADEELRLCKPEQYGCKSDLSCGTGLDERTIGIIHGEPVAMYSR